MPEDEVKRLRVTTQGFQKQGFQKHDGIEEFREIFGRKILGIEIDPLDGQLLEIDFTLRSLPGLAMATGSLSPVRNHHTTALIDNDDLVLAVVRRGVGELHQYGRATTVNEGEAVLTANGAVATFAGPVPTRMINFRLSRAFLAAHVADLDDRVARPIARENPVLQHLLRYASVFDAPNELGTAELRHMAAMHIHDIAALLLRGERGAGQNTEGLRAARLHAIKRDILQRIGQRSLTISDITRSQNISESYIRQLLAAEGTTFTDFVLGERLARAHRLLMDPLNLNRNISVIAYEAGFGDLSYFNRAFRRRFGATPSEVREAARQERDS
jgi:AraC-like DNA-binding protein